MKTNSIIFVINVVKTMSGAFKMMSFVAEAATEVFDRVYVVGIHNNDIQNTIPNVEIIPLRISTSSKGLWRISAIRRLRNIFKQINPKAICSFVSDACVTAKLASIGLEPFYISCERGDPYALNPIWKFLVSATYKFSDFCIFQLPQSRDFFPALDKTKTAIIPNTFVPKSIPIEQGEIRNKTIVSVGRLYENQKRFSTLIKAFCIVHQKYPEYRLIIYGDGESKTDYENLIDELDLNEKISLPGFVENPSDVIKQDGIFVLSSKYEGIPNSLIEAMSMGLPCVATDCSPGGARFLLADGKYGALVTIDDVEEMALEIIRFIESPEYSKEIGKRAKESIYRFQPEIIKELWLNIFKSIKEESISDKR